MDVGTTGEDEDYQQYYRKVELGWSLARGRQIIVSPLEFEEIEKWFEAGIPLPVVLRAIDLFIEKKNKAKRKRGYLLKDATSTVEKCWREYVDIHAGEGGEDDLLTSKMKALIRKIKALGKAWPDELDYIGRLVVSLGAISLKDVVAFDTIDAALVTLEAEMVSHFTANLDEDELAEIREDISDILTEEEDPEFFNKMLGDAVRGHFGLPKLTLLG